MGRFVPNIPEWGETEVILEEHLARIFSAVADGTYNDDLLKEELDTINEKVQTLINKRLEQLEVGFAQRVRDKFNNFSSLENTIG